MTPDTPADGAALYDDRTRPLLLQQAETRGAEDWRHEDAEAVIARLLAKIDSHSPRDPRPRSVEGPQQDVSGHGRGMGRPVGRMGDGGGMTTPLPAIYTPDTVAAHLGVSERNGAGTPQGSRHTTDT